MNSVTFLVSGGGGNLKFLYLAKHLEIISELNLSVISDRQCPALDFAKENDIEYSLVDYKRSDPKQLVQALEKINPDVVVTNWHKIIDSETVDRFSGKMINLHYSLLPAFSGMIGMVPVKKAYEQGCKFIGSTCHYVDEGVDTGKILAQSVFSTEKPFEKSINLMFRKGCLTLLAGIQVILDDNRFKFSEGFFDDSILPKTYFEKTLAEENFWEKVSEL